MEDWRHKSFGPEDAPEEVHQIHGTDISFSSKPDDLDDKAPEALREIIKIGHSGLKVLDNPCEDLQNLPKGFFLSRSHYIWESLLYNPRNEWSGIWRRRDFILGYGIGHHASGYHSFKTTYVYHKGNDKTNWIMVVYSAIHENSFIEANDVELCHVFQSDNYNKRPNPSPMSAPNIFDFHKKEVDARVRILEGLMENPDSFKDYCELDEMYTNCQANGPKGKRADVWKYYTPIKVLGPDGKVMLTLAICHACNMAYLTGKWDSEKGSVSNNGTKTLKEHYRKQHHIDIGGKPQGAHHQRH